MISHLKIASLLLFVILLEAKCEKYSEDDEYRERQLEGWKKSKVSRDRGLELEHRKKFNEESIVDHNRGSPPINNAALMARYIVNQADWTAVSTISSRKDIESYPVVNVKALSDGPLGNGSGIPHLFLAQISSTGQDLSKDNRASLLMTLAQGDYCRSQSYDPVDPRCARVILTGKIEKLINGTAEYSIAKEAMFGRHPWLAYLLESLPRHQFFFATLKMASIVVEHRFGGPTHLTVEDYLHPPVSNVTAEFLRYNF